MVIMTAAEARTLGLPWSRPLTYADLETLPDDGHRYELLDGMLVVTPSPSWSHQDVVGNLHVLLRAAEPEGMRVGLGPFDIKLADDTVLIPDLWVARRDDITQRNLPVPPLLAVEVLSPSTRRYDLLTKRDRYREAGTPSYWVVDPGAPSLTVWVLMDDAYVEAHHAVGREEVTLTDPFPVTIRPSDLLR
jgi:Uma2 family endonuclease